MKKENLVLHSWYIINGGKDKARYYGFYELSQKYIFMTDTYFEYQLSSTEIEKITPY